MDLFRAVNQLTDLYECTTTDNHPFVDFLVETITRAIREAENPQEIVSDIMNRIDQTVKTAGGDVRKNLHTAVKIALDSYVKSTDDKLGARSIMFNIDKAGEQGLLAAAALLVYANSLAPKNIDMAHHTARMVAVSLSKGKAPVAPTAPPQPKVTRGLPVTAQYTKQSGQLRPRMESIVTEELDLSTAIEIANRWHGGRDSYMYAFVESGGKLLNEQHREMMIREIRARMEQAQADQGEANKLQKLLTAVYQMPITKVIENASACAASAGGVAGTSGLLFGPKPKKKVKVKEDKAIFNVVLTRVTTTPESVRRAEQITFETESKQVTLGTILQLVTKHDIRPLRTRMDEAWSSNPSWDLSLGADVSHTLHVKIGGRELSPSQRSRLNGAIARVVGESDTGTHSGLLETALVDCPACQAHGGLNPRGHGKIEDCWFCKGHRQVTPERAQYYNEAIKNLPTTRPHGAVAEAVEHLDLRFLPADAVAWLVNQPEPQVNAAKEIGVAAHEVGNPITSGAVLRADTSVLVLHDQKNKATLHVYPDGGISANGQPVAGHEDVERLLGDIPPGQTSQDADCGCDAPPMTNLAEPMTAVTAPPVDVVQIDLDSPMTFEELEAVNEAGFGRLGKTLAAGAVGAGLMLSPMQTKSQQPPTEIQKVTPAPIKPEGVMTDPLMNPEQKFDSLRKLDPTMHDPVPVSPSMVKPHPANKMPLLKRRGAPSEGQ